MLSGEEEDLKPDKLKRSARRVKKYLARWGLNDDSPQVVDYYGAYTEGKANNAYQMLGREVEDLSLAQLTQLFQQLFEASTNTDNTYHKWQNVRQPAGSQPAGITKITGELVGLKGSLPAGSISDYVQKQRFLDAMDSRRPHNVEAQLSEEDTWDQMVGVAEHYDTTMYRTDGYKGSDRSQASSSKPSVRYWASGAPKPAGPRLNSLPRPGQWPEAGCFFFQPLPLPPSRPPPRSMPRTAPRQWSFSAQGPAFLYISLSNNALLIHDWVIVWAYTRPWDEWTEHRHGYGSWKPFAKEPPGVRSIHARDVYQQPHTSKDIRAFICMEWFIQYEPE